MNMTANPFYFYQEEILLSRRKVLPFIVIAPDGVSTKSIPNRNTPTLWTYQKGCHLHVWYRKVTSDDQVWFLTNYGWCPSKIVGRKDKDSLMMSIYNAHPLQVTIVDFELAAVTSVEGEKNVQDDQMGTIFCIELEVPSRELGDYHDKITTGVNKAERRALSKRYNETPVIRIFRTYKTMLQLDDDLDIHEVSCQLFD